MFLKLRIIGEIRELCESEGCNEDTIALLQMGVKKYIPDIKANRFNSMQGALMVVSNAILTAKANGTLDQMKSSHANIYGGLKRMWKLCGRMASESDEYGIAVYVGDSNPFSE